MLFQRISHVLLYLQLLRRSNRPIQRSSVLAMLLDAQVWSVAFLFLYFACDLSYKNTYFSTSNANFSLSILAILHTTSGLPHTVSKKNSQKLDLFANCSRELYLTERMTRIVRTNYSCEHSHSRECEYSGQNYYANVRANNSRECETALRLCKHWGGQAFAYPSPCTAPQAYTCTVAISKGWMAAVRLCNLFSFQVSQFSNGLSARLLYVQLQLC